MTAFTRTFARLKNDNPWPAVWTLVGATTVLVGWLCWAALAQVWLQEAVPDARIELDSAAYPVESPLLGRVVSSSLRIGQAVSAGAVLVEIDAMPEQLQMHQEQVQQQALQPQQARLHAQIDAEQSGRSEERRNAELSVQEAQARVHEAEFAATFADQELSRLRELQAQQMVSLRDLDKAETEAGRLRAAVSSLKATARRIQQEQALRERERDTRVERLRGELAALDAQRDKLGADIERRGYEVERRRIRSPVAGTVGEASSLHIGTVVQPGERLGAIVPGGELMVVAHYPVQAAIGRLRAGQTAKLRLDAYPWNEFGTVAAEVQRVAQEPRDGRVRVELAIKTSPGFMGVLAHGMPGTLEIAVEQVTPLGLLLRTAGQWLTTQR